MVSQRSGQRFQIPRFYLGNTPFRKLEELGGTDMMRGYYGGRFTDKCLMVHYSYGGGLRYMLSKEEKLNLRLDYGIARHSNAFTVQLREAF